MKTQPKIAILLSTYNGARFLAEQLDSILEQTYGNFLIVARDDGSNDDTESLLKDYRRREPERIHLIEKDGINLGAGGSFSRLIGYVLKNKQTLGLGPAYMMFCDQDDVWYPDKIDREVGAMLEAEASAGFDVPVPALVHSDLQVVSEGKRLIADSLIRYQRLEIERNRFPNIVISNVVTGCTALINESLARKAVPVPKHAIMHDWWLALVATAFGKLVFLDTPLVHYRQHDSNSIGAKEFNRTGPISKSFWQKVFGVKPNEHLLEVAAQARAFRQRFGPELGARENLGLRLSAGMGVQVGVVQRACYRLARRC